MKVALIGHGVVGAGVAELLLKQADVIKKRTGGESIDLKYILEIRDFPDLSYSDRFIRDFSVIEGDPEIHTVVEAIGGVGAAYRFDKAALLAGKNVVTSNKELVAEKGAELLAIAKEKNVNFLFEAAVCGGVPVIRPIYRCLGAADIQLVGGILNGTTNYILTKMLREHTEFQDALRQAQALGYAETDPTADIMGDDACRKICILASLVFGKAVRPAQVPAEGIMDIQPEDMACAESVHGAVKLIGCAERLTDGTLSVWVAPAFLRENCPLRTVDGVFNAMLVRSGTAGDLMFYGKGAGKLPTASSILADLLECAEAKGHLRGVFWEDASKSVTADAGSVPGKHYIRLGGLDEAAIEKLFGPVDYLRPEGAPPGERAFLTIPISPKTLDMLLDLACKQGAEVRSKLRVFE